MVTSLTILLATSRRLDMEAVDGNASYSRYIPSRLTCSSRINETIVSEGVAGTGEGFDLPLKFRCWRETHELSAARQEVKASDLSGSGHFGRRVAVTGTRRAEAEDRKLLTAL